MTIQNSMTNTLRGSKAQSPKRQYNRDLDHFLLDQATPERGAAATPKRLVGTSV